MSHRTDNIERLIAELNADMDSIADLRLSNERAAERIDAGATDQLDYAALGFTLHNIYGIIENYCLRIAKHFENDTSGDSWHQSLLRRMTLEIPGVRPALLSQAQLHKLDDLRSFRHAFRHLYARPIDPEKMMLLQRRLPDALAELRDAHEGYVTKLKAIAEAARGSE